MKHQAAILLSFSLSFLAVGQDASPNPEAAGAQAGRRGRFGGEIFPAPDDKAAYPPPPAGFDQATDKVGAGKMETVVYPSKSVGVDRKAVIYTPPGYSAEEKYPVLYLLHGIGGDENEWGRNGSPNIILDNLIAAGRAVPMIVVMPNGRAQPDDRPGPDPMATAPAFGKFDKDLLGDLIPFVERKYSVRPGRENRALAGLSMGGGQSLNFGLPRPETFGWVGGFSSAPNTRPAPELLQPSDKGSSFKLIYLSCGSKDGLLKVSQDFHSHLKTKGIQHVWHVDGHAHDFGHWKAALYNFGQLVFQARG